MCCDSPCVCLLTDVSLVWMLVVVEAFPAAAGECRLSGPVSDSADQQIEDMEVGAAQSYDWAPF